MKIANLFLVIISFLAASCATAKYVDQSVNWIDVVVTEDISYYVDTTSIRRNGDLIVAKEKRLFEPGSRQQYIDQIKDTYTKLGEPEKAKRWVNFSYSIYTKEYDCVNRRSRITSVEDYDLQGKRIQKTTTNKDKMKWVDAEFESVKDFTLFFVCDFDN